MVTALFKEGQKAAITTSLQKYDYGEVLRIKGLSLPRYVAVQFAVDGMSEALPSSIGETVEDVTDVLIPNSLLRSNIKPWNYNIMAYVYIVSGSSGKTEYTITIPVKWRPKTGDDQAADDDVAAVIGSAVEKMNTATTKAENAANQASATAEEIKADREKITTNEIKISGLQSDLDGQKRLNITKTPHIGYLKKEGIFGGEEEGCICEITPKIKCSHGDVFVYSGYYGNLAVACVFYGENNSIIGSITNTSLILVKDVEIVVPEGTCYVIFSSYLPNNSDEYKLNISLKGVNGLNEITPLVKRNRVNIEEAFEKLSLIDIGVIYANDQYLVKELGTVSTDPGKGIFSYITEFLNAKEGDKFIYTGHSQASTTSVAFYDIDKKCLYTSEFGNATEKEVICPPRTGYVRFASYMKNNKLSVYKIGNDYEEHCGAIGDLYRKTNNNSTEIEIAHKTLASTVSSTFVKEYSPEMEFSMIELPYGSKWTDTQYSIYASQKIPVAHGQKVRARARNYSNNIPRLAVFDSNENLLYTENPSSNGIGEDTYIIRDVKASWALVQGYAPISADNPTNGWHIVSEPLNPYIQEAINEAIESSIGGLNGSNVLYGKTWYCCGDSFSEGDYTDSPNPSNTKFSEGVYKGLNKVYSRFIAMRNNMDLKLLAKCGATCGMRTDDNQYSNQDFNPLTDIPSQTNNFFYNQLPKIGENPDYITLWFGINDSNRCELGAINDETVKTFYGALNWSMLYLITNFPKAHIGLVVSNKCNANYKQAIREVGQKWAIPYLDMEGDVRIPSVSGTRENQTIPVDSRVAQLRWNDNFRVSSTNGHPNEKAHEYQSTFIENWLRSL